MICASVCSLAHMPSSLALRTNLLDSDYLTSERCARQTVYCMRGKTVLFTAQPGSGFVVGQWTALRDTNAKIASR
jgi:hypothetical protein